MIGAYLIPIVSQIFVVRIDSFISVQSVHIEEVFYKISFFR